MSDQLENVDPFDSKGTYLVLAHTLEFHPSTPSYFDPSKPRKKVMGAYQTELTGDAAYHDVFDQFCAEWCPTVKDAQRFYNDITIVQVLSSCATFQLDKKFGELFKFPNKEAFTPVDIYY